MTRLINADALMEKSFEIEYADGWHKSVTKEVVSVKDINNAPTIDAVKVIRCKNCRYWNSETKGCKRNPSVEAWREDDFCKYGKRWSNAID